MTIFFVFSNSSGNRINPFRIPGNMATDALVEFVDIYPLLSDICNIPVP
jgi:hypothetical protein